MRVGEPSVREQREARKHGGVRTAESKADFTAKKDDDAGRNVDAATIWYYGAAKEEKELRSAATILFPGFRFPYAPPRTETPTRPIVLATTTQTERTVRGGDTKKRWKRKRRRKGGERSSSNTNNSNNSVVVVKRRRTHEVRDSATYGTEENRRASNQDVSALVQRPN